LTRDGKSGHSNGIKWVPLAVEGATLGRFVPASPNSDYTVSAMFIVINGVVVRIMRSIVYIKTK
jgi:hypothetical protein